MKLHIGTNPSGCLHSLSATHPAADITQLPHPLHGESAYQAC